MRNQQASLKTISNEGHYICRVLHAFVCGELAPEVPHGLHWGRFDITCYLNKVIPIVHSMLPQAALPPELSAKWQHALAQTLLNNTRAIRATAGLFKSLEQNDFPMVALRGLALTQWAYSDPILRPMVDVDLLIKSEGHEKFPDYMTEMGHKPQRLLRSQYIYEIDHTKFEVHWSFLTPKRYRSNIYDAWLDKRERYDTEHGPIYTLTPENELLDLVIHAFLHHELDGLSKLVDIALVAKKDGLDWHYIANWCKEAGMTRLFAITLAVTDKLLGLELLKNFPHDKRDLPRYIDSLTLAYAARMFGEERPYHVLQRKHALLFITDHFPTKLRQLLRFIAADQIKEFWNSIDGKHRLSTRKNMQKPTKPNNVST